MGKGICVSQNIMVYIHIETILEISNICQMKIELKRNRFDCRHHSIPKTIRVGLEPPLHYSELSRRTVNELIKNEKR